MPLNKIFIGQIPSLEESKTEEIGSHLCCSLSHHSLTGLKVTVALPQVNLPRHVKGPAPRQVGVCSVEPFPTQISTRQALEKNLYACDFPPQTTAMLVCFLFLSRYKALSGQQARATQSQASTLTSDSARLAQETPHGERNTQ